MSIAKDNISAEDAATNAVKRFLNAVASNAGIVEVYQPIQTPAVVTKKSTAGGVGNAK